MVESSSASSSWNPSAWLFGRPANCNWFLRVSCDLEVVNTTTCAHRLKFSDLCYQIRKSNCRGVRYAGGTANYTKWDRGLSGGTPVPTTIIICITLCAYQYIYRVRSERVLIFMYQAMSCSCSGYYHGRSCSICTRCFHLCSARLPTIPSIVGRIG